MLVAGTDVGTILTKCVFTLVVVVVDTSLSAGTAALLEEVCLDEWTCGWCGVLVLVLTTFLAGLVELDLAVVVAWVEVLGLMVVDTGLRCTLLEVVWAMEVEDAFAAELMELEEGWAAAAAELEEGFTATAAELEESLASVLKEEAATMELGASLTMELGDEGETVELVKTLAAELDDATLATDVEAALTTELEAEEAMKELVVALAAELDEVDDWKPA